MVDMFAGCGALSLGITEAARAVRLGVDHLFAADTNAAALDVYARNFAGVRTSRTPIESLVREMGARLSAAEKKLRNELGRVDILAGGPPCQGNSDLNNHTRRKDPKNGLFLTMVRLAQVLMPSHVIIENVPGVRHDKRGVTVKARGALERLGYKVTETILTATEHGVPQRRRRYFLVATTVDFEPGALARTSPRSLRWACHDLRGAEGGTLNSHASPSAANQQRIEYLFDHDLYDLPNDQRPPCHRLKDHSYNAVYGRLRWDEPAPTITSGFNSPGQGRFVHPEERRTLTPHEAARLQCIPDHFDWGDAGRESLTQMIGNAVPPKLAYAVALELLR